jgi:cytosine/adenosine deaminase-related metal-dependent hydrolase
MSQLSSLVLTNARATQGPHDAPKLDIEIQFRRIRSFSPLLPPHKSSSELNVTGMLILPGLINAHDHLDFALFPRLGNRTYVNARDWALDIYRPDRSPIREHLQVPKATRLFWGGLKNLLCGVTTVCHHNEYEPDIFEDRFPVRVLKRFGWSHSFNFSQDVTADFNHTPDGAPFFIHLAEGTDNSSRSELDQLDRLGLLKAQTVIVHGVALTSQDWQLVGQRGARLVWCPSSNLFTLGKTVDMCSLPSGVKLALGNDSPLTAAGDLLDEIRLAHSLQISRNPLLGGDEGVSLQGWVSPVGCNPPLHPSAGGESVPADPTDHIGSADQLYPMVTTSAAHLMGLDQGEGTIVEGGVADFLVVRDTGVSPAQRLVQLSAADIELVIVGGEIMFASTLLAPQLPPALLSRMQRLSYDQKECFVALDIQPHWEATDRILGKSLRLTGKEMRLLNLD